MSLETGLLLLIAHCVGVFDLIAHTSDGYWLCFFASFLELLWGIEKGGTIQEQIALINIVFIVESIKVIS